MTIKHTTLALLLMMVLSACGSPTADEGSVQLDPKFNASIVNGEAVANEDVISKSTVALYFNFPGSTRVKNFCTATVIAQDTVVTAAHCLVDVSQMLETTVDQLLPNVRVGLGIDLVGSLLDGKVQFVKVKSARYHQDYVSGSDSLEGADKGKPFYDIAIVRLESPLPADFKPVRLMADPAQLTVGLKLTLAGYGVIRGGVFPVESKELRKTTVTVDNSSLNPVQFSYAAVNGQSACSGDSGGPAYLIENDVLTLVGVTSWGDNNCAEKGVYTSVPALHAWIQETVSAL